MPMTPLLKFSGARFAGGKGSCCEQLRQKFIGVGPLGSEGAC